MSVVVSKIIARYISTRISKEWFDGDEFTKRIESSDTFLTVKGGIYHVCVISKNDVRKDGIGKGVIQINSLLNCSFDDMILWLRKLSLSHVEQAIYVNGEFIKVVSDEEDFINERVPVSSVDMVVFELAAKSLSALGNREEDIQTYGETRWLKNIRRTYQSKGF